MLRNTGEPTANHWKMKLCRFLLTYCLISVFPLAIHAQAAQTKSTDNPVQHVVDMEIFDIQGTGSKSPFQNTTIQTIGNIVTAVGPRGFTMQTPDSRADTNQETSNGIYVFTGKPPVVAVGDRVDVTGKVIEYFGFTEFTHGATVSIDSSNNPLPKAIALSETQPSSNPALPSCIAGRMECFEGMRVSISNAIVGEGNQSFGSDTVAELSIVASMNRAFREPGINYPGLPGLPIFDGNPEVFEIDLDRLGLTNEWILAGSHITAKGVLGFEYGDYELWPTSVTIDSAAIPTPVRARKTGEMSIGSLNLFRLFNDINDPGDEDNNNILTTKNYQTRLKKLSLYIRNSMRSPDVLGIQEVENISTLSDLSAKITADDSRVIYTPHLIEGNDIGGIDVAFLTRTRIAVDSMTQIGSAETLSVNNSLLHDRPPLLLEARYTHPGTDFTFAVMVNHTRSRIGIDKPGKRGLRVKMKRLEQAQSIAHKVQEFQSAKSCIPLAIIGDFNDFEFSDGYVDVVGQIAGDAIKESNQYFAANITDPVLKKQVLELAPNERYSFVFKGSAQTLDHALTNQRMTPYVRGFEFARGNADAPKAEIENAHSALRASDHDGFVLYVTTHNNSDKVNDRCFNLAAPTSE